MLRFLEWLLYFLAVAYVSAISHHFPAVAAHMTFITLSLAVILGGYKQAQRE